MIVFYMHIFSSYQFLLLLALLIFSSFAGFSGILKPELAGKYNLVENKGVKGCNSDRNWLELTDNDWN